MPHRNVKSLRWLVGRHLEHDPATIDTREARVDTLNTSYLDVSESADWIFLQQEVDWKVWADRTGTSTGFSVSVLNGSYLITFSSALDDSFVAANNGCQFVDENNVTYTINRFTSTTQAYLDRAYEGVTNVAMTTWTLATHRFYLPVDCTRALAFINRDDNPGRLVILDRRMEEVYLSWLGDTAGTVYWLVDDDAEYDQPPDPGMTAAEQTAAGSLAASSVYEVCYTLTLQGRESPPSVPVRVTTSTGATHRIAISGMQDTSASGLATGIYKNVYIRRLTSSPTLPAGDFYSRWLQAAANLTETTTTLTISSFPASNATPLVFQNGRKYMRTKWAPGSDQTLRLRYLRYPPRLVADSDVPKWPEAFHDLLAYGAAIDVGRSQGVSETKIAGWQKEYDRLAAQMRKSCLYVPDAPTRKRMRTDMGGACGPIYLTDGLPVGNFWGSGS
jgi:hypothetical protein